MLQDRATSVTTDSLLTALVQFLQPNSLAKPQPSHTVTMAMACQHSRQQIKLPLSTLVSPRSLVEALFPNQLPEMFLGKQQKTGPSCTYLGDSDGVLGSRFHLVPASAFVAIWGVK